MLEIFILIISLIVCGIIFYILGLIWFGDTRNHHSRSFFILGVTASLWTLLNGIVIISDERFFPFLYTIRMVTVAMIPFFFLWFSFNFTSVRSISSKIVKFLFWVFPSLISLTIITNPLHHFMFLDYSSPIPARGSGFWIHNISSIIVLSISLILLLRYILKYSRKEPIVIIAGIGTLLPYILNMLYSLEKRFIPYDITPLGFFITFLLFAISSYRSQLFNINALSIRSIFSLLKDVILVVNDQCQIIDYGPAAIKTFPDYPFVSGKRSLKDFFSYINKNYLIECKPDNLLDPESLGKEERNGEIKLRRDFSARRKTDTSGVDDSEITFSVTLKPLLVMKKPAGCIFVMSDVSVYHSMISEINEKNVRLEDLTKAAEAASIAKSAFLANMSHEIRTPLNAVIGMTLIARKSAVNEKNLTSILAIETASKHLLGILNDVLDMSKIESGKFELINDRFNLNAVMDEVKEIIRQRCTEKNIRLDTSFSEKKDIFVQGDHLRLKQVFINLLGNAVKFTPDNGTIDFSMNIIEENEKKMKVHFIVSDNGIGMTEEQLGRLFKTFSQADSTIYNRFGGTGLGLSISQNLVQMMGSQIIAKSKFNEGSSFEFTVDFDKAEESLTNEEGILNLTPDLSGKRILLVEDIDINRAILIELLTDTNVKIDEAENGEQAVDVFNKAPHGFYDLIFMDIRMPILDGHEATRRIRQLDRPDAKAIPIVAMTGDAYKEDIDKALASGMNGHLAKPIDISAVMKMLIEKLIHNQ